MAHFAKLNDQNIVTDVVVVNNESIQNLSFPESEPVGIEFLASLFDGFTNWKQTSYNASFRKSYAGTGYSYDPVRDAFIQPKPFASWSLNKDTCLWEPPINYPEDNKYYVWNEDTTSWKEVVIE